jgi:hypothetical protein
MRSPEAMERHPPVLPARGISLLRASVTARLFIVAVAVGVLWLSILWALA